MPKSDMIAFIVQMDSSYPYNSGCVFETAKFSPETLPELCLGSALRVFFVISSLPAHLLVPSSCKAFNHDEWRLRWALIDPNLPFLATL